jgi:iron complex transport system substrate-binding protein
MRIKSSLVLALTLVVGSSPLATAAQHQPTRIVSLSPSATEILYGIGAGKQVIAVDQNSNFPTSAPTTKLDGFTPNVEAIAKYKPDLVIIQSTSTKATQIIAQLKKLRIQTFTEVTPNNLKDLYSEISALGVSTGRTESANGLTQSMKKRISQIVSSVSTKGMHSFYHELDNTNYSATSNTFIGQVYSSFGLINIADKAAGADANGYPQLTPEYLLQSNPDLVFLADAQYGESADSFAKRPGFSALSAVKGGHVVALPADIPSRWGPRIVDFYSVIADALKKLG